MAAPITQTLPPQLEGGNLVVTIDEEEYIKGLKESKYNAIGILCMRRGYLPLLTLELKKKCEEFQGLRSRQWVEDISKYLMVDHGH